MPAAKHRNHSIHFDLRGDPKRPPLLLVMGMGLASSAWSTLPSRLARDFRVITFDNRGSGGSANPRRLYRMSTLAADALTVLDACAVQRAHVFGISMGGMVAQELALQHPERVDRLALGCTFASWRESRKLDPSTLGAFLRQLTRPTPDKSQSQLARLLVSEGFFATPQGKARFADWRVRAEREPARRVFLQLIAIALHSATNRLRELRAPTLVMAGDRDRLVHVCEAHKLALLIPDARLHILAGAGHVFPLEREEETAAMLTEHFLRPSPHRVRSAARLVASSC